MSTWVSPIHSPSSSSVSCPQAGESVTTAFFRRGGRRGEVLIDAGGNGAATGAPGNAGADWRITTMLTLDGTRAQRSAPSLRRPACPGVAARLLPSSSTFRDAPGDRRSSQSRICGFSRGSGSHVLVSPALLSVFGASYIRYAAWPDGTGSCTGDPGAARVARPSRRPDQRIRGLYEAMR